MGKTLISIHIFAKVFSLSILLSHQLQKEDRYGSAYINETCR